jgi:hypothetical protein
MVSHAVALAEVKIALALKPERPTDIIRSQRNRTAGAWVVLILAFAYRSDFALFRS